MDYLRDEFESAAEDYGMSLARDGFGYQDATVDELWHYWAEASRLTAEGCRAVEEQNLTALQDALMGAVSRALTREQAAMDALVTYETLIDEWNDIRTKAVYREHGRGEQIGEPNEPMTPEDYRRELDRMYARSREAWAEVNASLERFKEEREDDFSHLKAVKA